MNDHIRAADGFQTAEQAMHARHADVVHALDAVAHDLRGDGRLLGDGEVARPRADHGNGAGSFAQRFFLDGEASRQFMVDGALEFAADRARVFVRDARGEDVVFAFQQGGGDFDDLLGGFARAENHFGKTVAQSPVRVHLRKPEIGHGCRLKCAEDFVPVDAAGAELIQKLDGFGYGHGSIIRGLVVRSRQKRTRD